MFGTEKALFDDAELIVFDRDRLICVKFCFMKINSTVKSYNKAYKGMSVTCEKNIALLLDYAEKEKSG